MSPTLLVIFVAIGAVALFFIGYSITYFFKGRHMQTEVGDNDHMKQRGIKCASQTIREDEAALRGVPVSEIEGICSTADCEVCATECKPEESE